MTWRITQSQIHSWVDLLLKQYEVYAPTRKGSQFVFSQINTADEIALDYPTTILPPKKFFLPPREILLTYPKPGADPVIPTVDVKPRVIFGVHSYDLHGIQILKRIFMTSEKQDPYFTAMYNRTFLVGIDHQDDEYKFARDMKTNGLDCEYDLFLIKNNADYLILKGRENGSELINSFKPELAPVDDKEVNTCLKQREAAFQKNSQKLLADVAELPTILQATQESIIWRQEADKCFSCGSCNITCPTCYCFDIRDLPDIDSPGGKRMRIWDSCMLDVFAKVATGENFREKAHQRLKHRFNRKVWYHRDLYQRAACIGCGRCSRGCKAEINIIKVLNKLKEEYNYACSINTINLKK